MKLCDTFCLIQRDTHHRSALKWDEHSKCNPRHVFELTRFLSGMQDLERNSNETYPFERPFSMSSCTAFEGGMLSIFTAASTLALDSSSSTWVYVVMRPQFKEISVRSYPSDSWNVMQMYLVSHSCPDLFSSFFFLKISADHW